MMSHRLTEKVICFFVMLAVLVLLSACKGNLFSDKLEGIWISENVLYYDYKNYRYDVFPVENLPDDLFKERYLSVVKIDKNNGVYNVTVATYHLGAINRFNGNYVDQLRDLQAYDDRSLTRGNHDSNSVIDGDKLTIKDENITHITKTVKEGKRKRELEADVYERYDFKYDKSSDMLHVTEHYFETKDGQKITIPENDKSNVHKNYKKLKGKDFNAFCDDIWKKSFDMAQNLH